MELSIIVTSYRNPKLLKVCLDSIKKCAIDVTHELIVADSETEEDTEMMMREDYPEIKFFSFEKNVGVQVLWKKAIENSNGEYLLLLNGDLIVTEGSINRMISYMKENQSVGMLGPKLLNFNGTLQYSCFRFYRPITVIYRRTFLGRFAFAKKHLNAFLMKEYDHASIKEVDWLMGSAFMISRRALEKVGPTDSRYFMYFEDVDWCRRFWENGFKVIYYPFVSMHHYHGKGSTKGGVINSLLSSRLTWIHISSGIKYFKKFMGKPIPSHN